jgi:hypothetical protein
MEDTKITEEVCGMFEIKKTSILQSLGITSGAYIIEPMMTPEIRKRKLDQESVYFMVKQVEMPKETDDEPVQTVSP